MYSLIHGDCLEYIKTMPDDSVDVTITDPPYPGLKGGTVHLMGGVSKTVSVNETVGEPWSLQYSEWLPDVWRVSKYGVMIFCSHHSLDELPSYCEGAIKVGVVCWYKRNSPNPVNNVPKYNVEYVWLLKKRPGLVWRNLSLHYDIPMPNAGCFKTERILQKHNKKAVHPTQKPLRLMSELLKAVKPGMKVFDPFSGTATTLVAAIRRGCEVTGFEYKKEFHQIGTQRLQRAALQPALFFDPPAQAPTYTQSSFYEPPPAAQPGN